MRTPLFEIEDKFDYSTIREEGTGSHEVARFQIISVPFDRYIVVMRVSPTNEFLSIESISVNKDFLSYQEKLATLASKGYHDVEEEYELLETE